MIRRTYKLHLIGVNYLIVAIIPAKDIFNAISKYIAKTGFGSNRAYFCYLLTNTTEINTSISADGKYCVITPSAKTIGDNRLLRISSQQVRNCNDIFDRVDPKDINDPLFMRPTIEEVRKCVGFSKEPMYKLRKFCI